MKDCIFCSIVSGDIPAEKLYEDDRVLAFKDVNAQDLCINIFEC